jgi:hypothetical protein
MGNLLWAANPCGRRIPSPTAVPTANSTYTTLWFAAPVIDYSGPPPDTARVRASSIELAR